MSLTNRVILNTATNCLRLLVSVVVLLLLTPFILNIVGESDFGLWTLSFAALGFFGLLDLGFGTGVVKFVASAAGTGDSELRNRILSTTAAVYLGLTVVSILGVSVLGLYFNDFFSIPIEQQDKAQALFWIIAFRTVFLAIPLSLFRGILFGGQQIYLVNLVQTGSLILYALGAWVVLGQGMGIIALALINFGSMILEYGLYALLAYLFTDELRIRWSLVDHRLIGKITSFSTLAFIPQVAALVLLRTDPVIIKVFLPLSAVAIYGIALKISENIHLLVKQFVNVFTPVVAQMWGEKDTDGIRNLLLKGTKSSMIPVTVMTAALAVYSQDVIRLWIGPEFSEAGIITLILTLAIFCSVPQLMASSILTMTGHQGFTARAAVVSAVLNVALSLLLIGPLGLMGVALGTLIATLVVDVFMVLRQVCRNSGVSYGLYVRKTILPLLAPASALLILSGALRYLFVPNTLLDVVGQASAGCIAFALAFWFTGLDRAEKTLIRNHLATLSSFLPFRLAKEVLS